MKDVVYLNFAQLAYFNWHKLTTESIKAVGEDIYKLIDNTVTWGILLPKKLEKKHKVTKDKNGIIMYQGVDKRLFMKYSEEKLDKKGKTKPKYEKELSGWEFLYGADHEKIYETMKKETISESGFNGSAFKKEAKKKIIICYRGTDEFLGNDFIDNNKLAIFDTHSPQLAAAILFYNHIKELYGEGYEIHLTGHSLGGALAQYVCISTGGEHKTRTFNGVGIGIHSSIFKVQYIPYSSYIVRLEEKLVPYFVCIY